MSILEIAKLDKIPIRTKALSAIVRMVHPPQDHNRSKAKNLLSLLPIMLLLWMTAYVPDSGMCSASDQKEIFRILYINSYHPGYTWSDNIEDGLRKRLHRSEKTIELSVEYLDGNRFPYNNLLDRYADLIYHKYADFKHNLIIVSDNTAFDFAVRNRGRLFPGIPIVFCGYNAFHHDVLEGLSDITGVNEETDIDGLIKTAQYIQPKLETIVFILSTCNASGRPMARKIETKIIPKYQDKYNIVVLKDALMPEIKDTLSRLPRESAIFLAGRICELGTGHEFTPAKSGRLVSDASPVPVYTSWNFYLGTGVLGGRILSGFDQGETAGDIALQILDGKQPDTIPVVMHAPTRNIFDYNVMKKFHIDANNLPEGSTMINKPFSFYETYKKRVLIFAGMVSILLFLILIMFFNIIRRQRAERELQQHQDRLEILVEEKTAELVKSNEALSVSEKRYRELFNNINSGVAVYEVRDNGSDFIFKDFNRAAEKIDDDKRENLIGQSIFTVRPGVEKFGLIDVFRRVWETGESIHQPVTFYEDGKLKGWYENYVYKLPSNEIVAVFENVTAQRQMEEELQNSELLLTETGRMAKVGGWELDVESRKIHGTRETHRIYELPMDQEPDLQTAIDCIHPDDRSVVSSAIQNAIDHKEPWDLKTRLITFTGKRLWVHSIGKPIVREGRTVKLVGTFQDITHTKRMEQDRERLIAELKDALAKVRTLSGLLPICAKCKKVRDDKGYWNQLETYIRQHTDADVSHGLCPECMDEMYKGESWYEEGKQKGKF